MQHLLLFLLISLLFAPWTARAERDLPQAVAEAEHLLLDNPAAALEFSQKLLQDIKPEHEDLWLRVAINIISAYSYLEHTDEAMKLLESIERQRPHVNNPRWQILSLLQKTAMLSFQQKATEAIQSAKEAIAIAEATALPLYEARARSKLALLEARRGHKTAAIEQLAQAMRLLRGTERNFVHLVTLNFIATSFLVMDGENLSKALVVLKEMKAEAARQKLRFFLHLIAYNMGDTYVMLQNQELAIQSYQEAALYAEAIQDDLSQAYAQLGLADIYRFRKQINEAKEVLLKAAAIFKAHGNTAKIFECHKYLLDLALEDKDMVEARIQLKEIENLHLDPEQMGVFSEFELLKSRYFEGNGQSGKALASLKAYTSMALKESSQREHEAAQKYAADYELERKEQENVLLAQKNQIQELTIAQNKREAAIKTIIIGSASLLLILLSIGILRIRAQNGEIQRLNQHIKTDVLQRFLPPQLVEDILVGRSSLNKVPHHQTVTVLFSDLCEFTRMTDVLDADTIAAILNEFFVAMTDVIFSEDGTIDKFIGDAIMVLFGAPNPMPPQDQAQKAARCALKMQAKLQTLNDSWTRRYGYPMAMRIGLHQGPAVVGSFGGRRRSDYTAVGRAVNLASRVESIAEPGSIYLTEAIATYLEARQLTAIGMTNLRGLAEAAMIYKLQDDESHESLKDSA